ncbi:MAG: alpha/beta hydrolase [Chloroflexi bacterium]|nr:alpha/beta hydrolase [Chloroflexota bacterium]
MICTLNGIKDSARDTTDKLANKLEGFYGHHVARLEYPTRYWHNASDRALQYQDGDHVLRQVEYAAEISGEPVDLVAHSHGCLLASRMMEMGGSFPFRVVWLIAPALDCAWRFPATGANRIHVVSNHHDRAILAAAFYATAWGGMGRFGWSMPAHYRGPPVTNHFDEARKWGRRMHSHYFHGSALTSLAERVHGSVKEANERVWLEPEGC